MHIRKSHPLEKSKYIQTIRSRSIRLQKEIMPTWYKDSGFQFKDVKTGLIKNEGPKSVPEYLRIIFGNL